jgi:hypothetical protein
MSQYKRDLRTDTWNKMMVTPKQPFDYLTENSVEFFSDVPD